MFSTGISDTGLDYMPNGIPLNGNGTWRQLPKGHPNRTMDMTNEPPAGVGHNSRKFKAQLSRVHERAKPWHTPAKQSFEEATAANAGPGRHLYQLNWLIEIIFDPRLGETPIVVKFLAAAVRYNNRETGTAFPGLRSLAEDIYRDLKQFPPKTAEDIVKKVASLARACGYVLSRKQAPPGGNRAIGHYTFTLPDPDERQQAIAIYQEWLVEENAKRAIKRAASEVTAPVTTAEVTVPVTSAEATAGVTSDGGCGNRHRRAEVTATGQNRPPTHYTEPKKINLGADAPSEGATAIQDGKANPKVEARSSPKRATHAAAPAADALAAFERFWEVFPAGRKRDKADTRDLFVAIVTGKHKKRRATAEVIVAAVERYAATRPDPQYTPMPSTWLNGGRWEDDECQPKREAACSDEEAELAATLERMRAEEGWQ